MKRATLMRVLSRVGLAHRIASEDVNGIILRREGNPAKGTWGMPSFVSERWRLQCGGGIAGNGGVWWAEEMSPRRRTVGPMRTAGEAEKLLRLWKRWEP